MILFRRAGAFRCTGTKKRRATRDRRLWELALAMAMRDALRGGGLYPV